MIDQVVLRVVAKLTIPWILVFAVYVITHGELGPGGGFQGGVIAAAAFILYGIVFGLEALEKTVPPRLVLWTMVLGTSLYVGVGITNLLLGGQFLDYSTLNPAHPGDGEALGMLLVESGVGITVCAVMITIYSTVALRPSDGDREPATVDGPEEQP